MNNSNSLTMNFGTTGCVNKSKNKIIDIDDYVKKIEQVENENPEIMHNTKLMITKLRKVFYNSFGWNDELIRGTEGIKPFNSIPPELDVKTHIIKLSNGYIYDIAHVFAILDASNYPGYFTPLPNSLMFLHKLFPTVDSRVMAAGWLGDMSALTGQFLFAYKAKKRELTQDEKQVIINEHQPCDKMLANIDAMIILNKYNLSTNNGQKFSEILNDYYGDLGMRQKLHSDSYLLFAEYIGLKNWNGEAFENETQWLNYYTSQLKTATAFYLFFFKRKLRVIFLSLLVWLGFYKKETGTKEIMMSFLEGLKTSIQLSQKKYE